MNQFANQQPGMPPAPVMGSPEAAAGKKSKKGRRKKKNKDGAEDPS